MKLAPAEDSPLVSVVITTRNRLDWLKYCVASVQAQAGVSRELIVVDDASQDQTEAWLRETAGEQFRFYRFETCQERCAARNRGLAMARGRYVMFLDDDDYLWPGALRLLAGALEKAPGAVAAAGGRWAIFTREAYERRDAHPRRSMQRDIMDELLFGWSAVSGQNLYRTSLVRSIGGYEDEKLVSCEDRLLWYRMAMQGEVVLVPEVVMSYRYHDAQSRPAGIHQMRNRVARRAIRSMPRDQWRKALRLRRSGHWIDQAEEQMAQGNPLKATFLCCQAVLGTPGIFASPLIGPWVFRRLAGRLYRRFFPAPVA